MPLPQLLDVLAAAELAFARFNAERTSASPDADIGIATSTHFRWLADASRPGHAYYNRAVALHVGVLPPEALGELPDTVAAIELRPAETESATANALLDRGFRPAGALCYLAMRAPLEQLDPRMPVHRLADTQTDLFFDLLESAGTPFPPTRRAAKRHLYCTATFQAFVVTETTGQILGWSTMFLDATFAFFGNSYTRPEARGRGVHAALLAARLNAAADAGVKNVFTDVEHGSQSHANCERIGFRTVTVNTIWQRGA